MLTDEEGLRRAYAGEGSHGIYVDRDTAYVAGSTPPWQFFSRPGAVITDWFRDDVLLGLGSWGTRRTYRYQDEQRVLKANPQIRRIVGHSLSAATSLQIDDDNPGKYDVTAYSTPTIALPGSQLDKRRVKGFADPISLFDGAAGTVKPTTTLNPHDFSQIARNRVSPIYQNSIATKDGYMTPEGEAIFR